MRRNRKMKKHTVFRSGSVGAVVLIVTMFIMAMVYWTLDSRCDSISAEIGKYEKRFAALEAECVQEAAHWDGMKTPEKLSNNLVRFGLEMNYARQDQIVRMNVNGVPMPNQISVARARQRSRNATLAMQGGVGSVKGAVRPSMSTAVGRGRTTVRR